MRVCLAYDCLFPHTIGGAERWYRSLAEHLVRDGHDVTYLTLRQWPKDDGPQVVDFRVVTVGPELELYAQGRRRLLPPATFGAGVLAHLLRRGGDYDVVHTASFPYFSVLAAAAARRRHRYPLFVDWLELWTRDYWRGYVGALRGDAGWRIQRTCVRTPHTAFCFSRLHERRLREEGYVGDVTILGGAYEGRTVALAPEPAEPVVVFAGRHIPEKRVTAVVPAVARARARVPALSATIFGDGPERPAVLAMIGSLGLVGAVTAPGFAPSSDVADAMRRALCLVLPSRREGYGLVVVEAAANGTPSVVVQGEDNAATELVVEGVNGTVAPSASADDLAEAILRVYDAGQRLRETTAAWFDENADRVSAARSAAVVAEAYRERTERAR